MGHNQAGKLVSETRALFARTLSGGYEDSSAWKAVSKLRCGGRLVFDYAAQWIQSGSARKRARAAAILGQLGRCGRRSGRTRSEHAFPQESFTLLRSALSVETDQGAICSILAALGHLYLPDAVPFIVPFASHPNANVRFDAAFALGCYPSEPASLEALETLMDDTDEDVRNWAIFGIGVQSDFDSEGLRDKLVRHLQDPFLDARIEAAASLAKRKDKRVVAPLINLIERDGLLRGYIKAAEYLLEMDCPDSWETSDYVSALSQLLP
jgi:hypothetical protein